MKKGVGFYGTLAVMMSGLIFTGCGSRGQENGKTSAKADAQENKEENNKYKLGYSSLAFFDEGCKRIADGFTDNANQYSDMDITVLDGNSDMQTQISNLDAFWADQVDAVAIQTYPGIETNLKRFADAGKPVIFVDFYPVITDDIQDMDWYYVGSGDYQMGKAQGEWLAEHLPQDAKVCEVIINFGQQNATDRSQGLHDVLEKERPDVVILDTQAGMVDSSTTMKIVEDWLQKYGPDGINAIVSQSTASTSGIIEVLKAHDLTDKIDVVSADETPDTAKEWIGNGWVDATAYQDLQQHSVKAMEIAEECFHGNPPEQKEYYMERKIYTKDNLEQYGE